ncbi:MAG: hypothetical protein AB7L92_08325 [Alphaproteobacteria bacterium]
MVERGTAKKINAITKILADNYRQATKIVPDEDAIRSIVCEYPNRIGKHGDAAKETIERLYTIVTKPDFSFSDLPEKLMDAMEELARAVQDRVDDPTKGKLRGGESKAEKHGRTFD